MAMDIYLDENKDRFPPIDDTKNNFIFDGNVLYPEYLADIGVTQCPEAPAIDWRNIARLHSNDYHPDSSVGDVHADCITDRSYVYLGWLVMSDQEAEAFFGAYDELSPEDYDESIRVPKGKGNARGQILNRLSLPVDGFLAANISQAADSVDIPSSTIPIIWDRPYTDLDRFHHRDHKTGKPGGHVLYKDGHVEFVAYGEKFPMTETMARLLEERPRAPISHCEE
jgi:hypothetical protein